MMASPTALAQAYESKRVDRSFFSCQEALT